MKEDDAALLLALGVVCTVVALVGGGGLIWGFVGAWAVAVVLSLIVGIACLTLYVIAEWNRK
jgi:uncharacterized membrane protein (Fun14 family)